MVTYKPVKYPKRLSATPMTVADMQRMEHAETIANRGVNIANVTQINCKYKDDTTYVVFLGELDPVKFSGYIAPEDVEVWLKAKYRQAAE